MMLYERALREDAHDSLTRKPVDSDLSSGPLLCLWAHGLVIIKMRVREMPAITHVHIAPNLIYVISYVHFYDKDSQFKLESRARDVRTNLPSTTKKIRF